MSPPFEFIETPLAVENLQLAGTGSDDSGVRKKIKIPYSSACFCRHAGTQQMSVISFGTPTGAKILFRGQEARRKEFSFRLQHCLAGLYF